MDGVPALGAMNHSMRDQVNVQRRHPWSEEPIKLRWRERIRGENQKYATRLRSLSIYGDGVDKSMDGTLPSE